MVERIPTKVLGQFEPSAFGVEILDLLRVPSDDSASERTFYLVAKILDKDIQEVDVLLPEVCIAHSLCAKLTCVRKHGHQKAPHVFCCYHFHGQFLGNYSDTPTPINSS